MAGKRPRKANIFPAECQLILQWAEDNNLNEQFNEQAKKRSLAAICHRVNSLGVSNRSVKEVKEK